MWVNLLVGLLLSLVSALLAPKPEVQQPKAATGADIPRTKEGAEIGKVYGTVWIMDPHVAWYGDFESKPIKTKQGKK